VRALEAFLADIYGPQNAIKDGVIPARIITSSSHFHRQAAGIEPPNGVRIQVSGIDLIRDEVGAWRVLEDNVRVPSGVSYVISNRRVMAETCSVLAARLGNVTIANAVGNGVADDKLVYTYLPDLTEYYLGEKPIIPNVQTWRLEDKGALEEVLDRLDELVVKPVDGSGAKGLVIGPAGRPARRQQFTGRWLERYLGCWA